MLRTVQHLCKVPVAEVVVLLGIKRFRAESMAGSENGVEYLEAEKGFRSAQGNRPCAGVDCFANI